MCEDYTAEFKKPFQLFDQMCNDKILYSQCGDVVSATNAVVLGILGNSKSDEMNVKVLDLKQFLPILQSVAKNKNQGIYEDYAKTLLSKYLSYLVFLE
uniref:Uncharacterized protein n=1 Tax=Marmota marmota marmota TaxID=9994 RepID=A0A8C5YU12_MARMA